MANDAQAKAPRPSETEAASAVDRVLATLKSGMPDRQGRHVLIRALLAPADAATLDAFKTSELVALVDHAMAFLQEKPVGAPKVAVRRLSGDAAVLEILNQDMPFLLDSVFGELHARGLAIGLVLHPLIKIERTADGKLVRIAGAGDRQWSDGRQESYIAVHLERLPAGEDENIAKVVADIVGDVRTVVSDWKPMLARLRKAISDLRSAPPTVPEPERNEAMAFLEWLEAGNMTLLGMRDYRLDGDMQTGTLAATDAKGLGLLQDPALKVLRRGSEFVTLTPEIRNFYLQPNPLIITKANVRSRVHRRGHMDYIGVKTYGADGRLAGELRIVGLFTSQAYVKPPLEIPFLRRKVGYVLDKAGFPPESHAGKSLVNVLDTFPRDELFQISRDDLVAWSTAILDLDLRPRVRVFARVDRFDRFVSVLVYAPRDRYSTRVRERIGAYLADAYKGYITAFYPYFTEGQLVRVHFIVGRTEGTDASNPDRDARARGRCPGQDVAGRPRRNAGGGGARRYNARQKICRRVLGGLCRDVHAGTRARGH